MGAIESFEHNGVTVEVHYDTDCESPRDYEGNIGLFLGFPHRRYTIGDEPFDPGDAGNFPCPDCWGEGHSSGGEAKCARCDGTGECAPESLEDLINLVKARYDARMVLVVSMTDHSGVSYYTGLPRDPWDSGVAGLIVATNAKIAEHRPDVTDEELEAELVGEVREYGHWANGECYGYIVLDPDGEETDDSCWGFIGWDAVMEAGKEAADNYRHPRVELPDDVLITL